MKSGKRIRFVSALTAFALLLCLALPVLAEKVEKTPQPKPTPKSTSNPDARIGLSVKEVGLKKYNQTRQKLGARAKDTAKLSALADNEIYVPYIVVANYRNGKFKGILTMEVKGDTALKVRWDTAGIPKGYKSTYWLSQFPKEKGTYQCTWYYDDIYLIDRTFVIE